jgi:predicted MFS family arabinose efflux permease
VRSAERPTSLSGPFLTATVRDTLSPASLRRSRYALFVLFLVGVFNMMDRQLLSVFLEPIRNEFGASDAAMGLLTGYAFVLFYSLASVPLGRLADVHPRRTIIAIGLGFWSLMTSVSGLARSFGQLALMRVGLGVGEATFYPAGMSVLSDTFPPQRRPLALAVYSMSLPVGAMISLALGGWLGQTVGWRIALVWMGAPGFLLALIVCSTLREPARGGVEVSAVDVDVYSLRATSAYLWGLPSFRHLAAGMALSMFATTALGAWGPAFLIRVHGMEIGRGGVSLGAATGIGGVLGVLLGGLVTQRVARADARWLLGVPAVAKLAALPFTALFLLLPSESSAVPMYFGVALFTTALFGPVMTAVQGLAKVRMRALAAASVSLLFNLFGVGLGPLVAGSLSDMLRPAFGDTSLRYALLATSVASVWSAVHFALGAPRLAVDLRRAA